MYRILARKLNLQMLGITTRRRRVIIPEIEQPLSTFAGMLDIEGSVTLVALKYYRFFFTVL